MKPMGFNEPSDVTLEGHVVDMQPGPFAYTAKGVFANAPQSLIGQIQRCRVKVTGCGLRFWARTQAEGPRVRTALS